MIKAIETSYNGYRFRSRLEARWAVFFDTLGIRYKYEEYGFEQDRYRWLPDFYLPDYGAWVEVKGGKPSAADAQKMGHLLDFTSPLPFFCGCREFPWSKDGRAKTNWDEYYSLGGLEKEKFNPGLLLLGEVPNPGQLSVFHPFIRHESGLCRDYIIWWWDIFQPPSRKPVLEINVSSEYRPVFKKYRGPDTIDGYAADDDEAVEFFNPDVYLHDLNLFYAGQASISKAYTKARGARFEHGETPC